MTRRKKNIDSSGSVRRGHGGHEVVRRIPALAGGERVGVREHVGEHRRGTRVDRSAVRAAGDGRVVGILIADHAVGPLQDLAAIGERDAEEIREVVDRVVVGHIYRQVTFAPLRDLVDEQPGPRRDAGGEPFDAPGGEHAGDDPPEPAVIRRIEVEHHPPDERQVGGVGVADLGGAEPGTELGGRPQDAHDVRVAGHRPEPGPGRPVADLVLLLPVHGVVVT
jgi:hypothetical protein